jgi:IS605 OrfB family transposase
LKTIKIKIKPNKEQKLILKEWFDTSRAIYNKTVKLIDSGSKISFKDLRDKLVTANTKKNDINYKNYTIDIKNYIKEKTDYFKLLKNKLKINKNESIDDYYKRLNLTKEQIKILKDLDNKIKTKQEEFSILKKNIKSEKNEIVEEWELNTPKEIRAGAVNDVCKAYKTGFTNLKQGNIRYFKIGTRKKRERQTIILQKNLINIKNDNIIIAPQFLEENKIFKMGNRTRKKFSNLNIDHDVRLSYHNGEYWLYIPKNVEIKKREKPKTYCGVDPGVKTFMTTYGSSGIAEYCNNRPELLKKLHEKIEKISKNYKNQKNTKRKLRKLEKKRSNLIDELHWKTINNLLKDNDCIFYGDIKSHNIVKGGKNKKLNKDMNDLKFYKFKQRLEYKADVQGKLVITVHESNTTKTCSSCGNMKEVGLSRVYNCDNCKIKIDRDINSAKNMLIKGITYYA